MGLTVIQRFYEMAKQEAEAPALGMEYDGCYHDLPWWFVKSKAKHFGIGLLEAGAREGEYFYLFPAAGSTWVYAELGALTVGLSTLPLPSNLGIEALEKLFHRFPPAFLYLDEPQWSAVESLALRNRGLRGILLPREPAANTEQRSPLLHSFREIFNAGIVHETKHHRTYRGIRQSIDETRVMSPIRIDSDGLIHNQVLVYGEVNEACAKLGHAAAGIKIRKIFSDFDPSRSLQRIACLYWPIFLGVQSILDNPERDLFFQLRRLEPEILHLRNSRLRELEEGTRKEFLPFQNSAKGNLWTMAKNFLLRRKLRQNLGGAKAVLTDTVPGEFRTRLETALQLRWIDLQTPNFSL